MATLDELRAGQAERMNLPGTAGPDGWGDLGFLAAPTCPHCGQAVREGSRPYSGPPVPELEEFNRRHGTGGYVHKDCPARPAKDTEHA